MAVALWTQRRRVCLPLVVYALVLTFMITGYSTVGPRPRIVLGMLPGFLWLAAWLPRWAVITAATCLTAGAGVVAWLWASMVVP